MMVDADACNLLVSEVVGVGATGVVPLIFGVIPVIRTVNPAVTEILLADEIVSTPALIIFIIFVPTGLVGSDDQGQAARAVQGPESQPDQKLPVRFIKCQTWLETAQVTCAALQGH